MSAEEISLKAKLEVLDLQIRILSEERAHIASQLEQIARERAHAAQKRQSAKPKVQDPRAQALMQGLKHALSDFKGL